jgi:acetyltransferase-like isoleucine patch superfamily enzyme
VDIRKVLQRFVVPAPAISLYYYLKYRCKISPRAEVELSPQLIIGQNTQIGSFTKIKATDGPLAIGQNVSVATGCFIASHRMGIHIGDDCLISPNVTIVASSYNYSDIKRPIWQQGYPSKGIRIGNNVWIGAGACILDGTTIGNGVIIAAHSVVASEVPDNAIVKGDPAKVLFIRR